MARRDDWHREERNRAAVRAALGDDERRVSQISTATGLSTKKTLRHLKRLKADGIAKQIRLQDGSGKSVWRLRRDVS